jgi:hypothetical protein
MAAGGASASVKSQRMIFWNRVCVKVEWKKVWMNDTSECWFEYWLLIPRKEYWSLRRMHEWRIIIEWFEIFEQFLKVIFKGIFLKV